MNPQKIQLLQSFLAALPERFARPLATAVEYDRLTGGHELPHEVILEGLRPALAKAGDPAARPPSPLRLFCAVFEDLLTTAPQPVKVRGRIARSSLLPLWMWLRKTVPDFPALDEALRLSVLKNDAAARMTALAAAHRAAAQALAAAFAGHESATPPALAAALGSQAAAEDAREIGLMLAAASDFAALQRLLPKPIPHLAPALAAGVRDVYDRLNAQARGAAAFVPLVVMARLAKPWEVLRLSAQLARHDDDTLIAATDLGMAGELLLAELEELAARLAALRPVDLDAAAAVERLARFAALSAGIAHELGIKRDGKWGRRLMAARARVAESMETLLERAPRDVLAALPHARPGRGARRLDLPRAPDPDRALRAEKLARLMAGARPHAAAAAFHAALAAAVEEIAPALRAFNEELLRELRAPEDDARARAQAHLELALKLSQHLLGGEETDLVRRRARAA